MVLLLLMFFAEFALTARVVSQQFIHTSASANRYETQLSVGAHRLHGRWCVQEAGRRPWVSAHLEGKHITLQLGEKPCSTVS